MAATPMNDPPSSRCSSSLFAVVTGGLAAHGLLFDGAVCINRGFPFLEVCSYLDWLGTELIGRGLLLTGMAQHRADR